MFEFEKPFLPSRTGWLAAAILIVILYLVYSPTFLTDYLTNDEWAIVGSGSLNLRQLLTKAGQYFLIYGRGLLGLFEPLVYGIAGYDPFRIQFIRFINFASLAAIAAFLLWFIADRAKSVYFAFFVVLLLFSQPAIQAAMGYSLQLISTNVSALWLSLLAFYLHFYVTGKSNLSRALIIAAVFMCLLLAMQANQTYALFSLVPLSFLTLTDWENRKSQVLSFLGIGIVVLILSTVFYAIGLEILRSQGQEGYLAGTAAVDVAVNDPLRAILKAGNPFSYWSAFKIWTYPFPLHQLQPLGELKRVLGSTALLLWLALILTTIVTELRGGSAQERKQTLLKWLMVLVCLGLGAVPMIADSPLTIVEYRPHLTLTFTGIAIFAGAYSLQVLAEKYRLLKSKPLIIAGCAVVLLIAVGAQADLLRGMVNNRADQINFIRTELLAKDPGDYQHIVVVMPEWRGCNTEPCGPWMGQATSYEWHLRREGVYRYALETMNIPTADRDFQFVETRPDQLLDDAVVVDWNRFADVRLRQLESGR